MSGFKSENGIRVGLGVLHAVIALNAIGGGWYGISGAKKVPREWLQGTPFPDYFIPSLFLLVIIGGTFLFASLAVFLHLRIARGLSLFAGVLLLAWIGVQVALIGYVSWMQPVTALAGVLILALTGLALPRRAGGP